MNSNKRKPELTRVKLSALVTNSEQGKVYDDLPAGELKMLLEDIRRRGFEHLIEVYQPVDGLYEILDGHQRKRVAELLGLGEIDVLVRYDLSDASPAEKQVAFISANLTRRQLDTVGKVRAAIRSYEWQQHPEGRKLSKTQIQRARETIGAMVGLSGRTVSRYIRLARTPLEVQRAVSRGVLPLVIGEQISELGPDKQAAIADKISQATAQQIREILRPFVLAGSNRHRKVTDALNAFAKSLKKTLGDLEHRVVEIHPQKAKAHAEVLGRGAKVIAEILKIASGEEGSAG